MAILRYSAAIRAASLTAKNSAIGASAKIRVYSGSMPTNVDTAISGQTLLVELTGNASGFGSVANDQITAGAITNGTAVATGTATWARIFKADGTTPCIDVDVATAGASLNLSSTSVNSGQTVGVSSCVITAANIT